MFPCAGIIVFDGDNTILVSTNRGNHSFPKGKREKWESYIDTAWRELKEETGLTQEHVKLLDDTYIDEFSEKGNPSVRYFTGQLIIPIETFTFDKGELETVKWVNINDAYTIEKLSERRKITLKCVYERYLLV